MSKKINVCLIFGGRSGEHQVSLVSAWNIFHGLDRKKYKVSLIGISQDGSWHFGNDESLWSNHENIEKISLNTKMKKVTAVQRKAGASLVDLKNGKKIAAVDVFFPITHGTFGEDGCLQGLFEMIDVAYVGPGVLGSSIGMDKEISKRILRDSGFFVAKFYAIKKYEMSPNIIERAIRDLKFPIFVKPARLGSSVGISKAINKKDLLVAISEAFQYDTKIILEEAIVGREIECAILGNDQPLASIPGEIELLQGFYSYSAKYVDTDSSRPIVKAELSKSISKKIMKMAVNIFKTLECEGMSRIDFFLTSKGKVYVNEINTLPGFTNVSMYPKMLEQTGVAYSGLLDRLIALAMERKEEQSKLKRIF